MKLAQYTSNYLLHNESGYESSTSFVKISAAENVDGASHAHPTSTAEYDEDGEDHEHHEKMNEMDSEDDYHAVIAGVKKTPKFPAAQKMGRIKCPICAKELGEKTVEHHFIRGHRDDYKKYFGVIVPTKTLCDFPKCEAAFPIAKDVADHKLKRHGIENEHRLTDLTALMRMSSDMLKEKFADEARVLNFLNQTVVRLRARITQHNLPFEVPESHGLDITTFWHETGELEINDQNESRAQRTVKRAVLRDELAGIRVHAMQEGQLPSGNTGSRIHLLAELRSILCDYLEDKDILVNDYAIRAELQDLILTFSTKPDLTNSCGFVRHVQLIDELAVLLGIFNGAEEEDKL